MKFDMKTKTQFFSGSTIKTSCHVKGEWAGLGGEWLQRVCDVRHVDLQRVNSVWVFLRLNEASGEVQPLYKMHNPTGLCPLGAISKYSTVFFSPSVS